MMRHKRRRRRRRHHRGGWNPWYSPPKALPKADPTRKRKYTEKQITAKVRAFESGIRYQKGWCKNE